VSSYRRTTVYLTEEQQRWLQHLAAQASLDDVPISASDAVRLGIDRLRALAPDQLRTLLVTHIHDEALRHPGRIKRGMPVPATPSP
jgi:hypothetical protein